MLRSQFPVCKWKTLLERHTELIQGVPVSHHSSEGRMFIIQRSLCCFIVIVCQCFFSQHLTVLGRILPFEMALQEML